MELHNELIQRYKKKDSVVDKALIVDKNTIYIGKSNGNGMLLSRFRQEFLHAGFTIHSGNQKKS
jgi:hypothetical protein